MPSASENIYLREYFCRFVTLPSVRNCCLRRKSSACSARRPPVLRDSCLRRESGAGGARALVAARRKRYLWRESAAGGARVS